MKATRGIAGCTIALAAAAGLLASCGGEPLRMGDGTAHTSTCKELPGSSTVKGSPSALTAPLPKTPKDALAQRCGGEADRERVQGAELEDRALHPRQRVCFGLCRRFGLCPGHDDA